jgi:predicted ArsR family transcriptional regulator
VDRLPVLKALGDNTRYAIYLEVARSAAPRSTSDIADTLGLHPNTVRPHLERMREVGLLDVTVDSKGHVGRPQHRYSLSPGAPSLGFEPPAFPLLARMLAVAADAAGAGADEAAATGRAQGKAAAGAYTDDGGMETGVAACAAALVAELEVLGFDPAAAMNDADGSATIAFTHCPYRELAEAFPHLVCQLHRGLVEGFVERVGGDEVEVAYFGTLIDREPCQVTVVEG